MLHIISPDQYPIYDQNVHRTYRYINNLDYSRIDSDFPSDKDKIIFYHTDYLPFVIDIVTKYDLTIKQIDEAFFSFGRFLKGDFKSLL